MQERKYLSLLIAAVMTISLAACQSTPKMAGNLPAAESSSAAPSSEPLQPEPEPPIPPAPESYSISTVEELFSFAAWTAETPLDQQEAVTWTLTADLDLAGREWIPAGEVHTDEDGYWISGGFAGHFDGGGHTITGITVKAREARCTGFFGALFRNAIVENLYLEGEVTGEYQTGGLVGDGGYWEPERTRAGIRDSVTVRNCSFTGTVRGTFSRTGGLIGIAGQQMTVRNCQVKGDVFGSGTVGGFVGLDNTDTRFENCSFSGTVIANGWEANETDFDLPRMIRNRGAREPDAPEAGYIGGFLGSANRCTLVDCRSDAAVIVKVPAEYAGAFFGCYANSSGGEADCFYNRDRAGNLPVAVKHQIAVKPTGEDDYPDPAVEGLSGDEFYQRFPEMAP